MAEERTGVSVAEAAGALGITPEAVRKRLARGTLPGHRVGRTWRVHLDDVAGPGGHQTAEAGQSPPDTTALVTALQGEVEWLRAEVIRKDQLLAAMTQRIPLLEAPKEPGRRRQWWRFWERSEPKPEG